MFAFTLALNPLARYTLVRGHSSFFPPCLDRLDAWSGLRPVVTDALRLRLAGRRCARNAFSHAIAPAGHAACASVSISSWNFLCSGYRQTHSQRPDSCRNHSHHGSARRRNPCLRILVSLAGVSHRLGMGSLVGLTARGRPEYHRTLHDLDGAALRIHLDSLEEDGRFASRDVAER